MQHLSPSLQKKLFETLQAIVGARWISQRVSARLAAPKQRWFRFRLNMEEGYIGTYPLFVVWPKDSDELMRILIACRQFRESYLSSSSFLATPCRWIRIAFNRMDAVQFLDPEAGFVEVQVGIRIQHLEEFLNRHGVTLGHFPPSLFSMTLADWLVEPSLGYAFSPYGTFSDMILAVQLPTASGENLWIEEQRLILPLMTKILDLSAFITTIRLKIHKIPPLRHFQAILFPSFDHAFQAMRHLQQRLHPVPFVMNLYDKRETFLLRFRHSSHFSLRSFFRSSKDLLPRGLRRKWQLPVKKLRHEMLKRLIEWSSREEHWLDSFIAPQALLFWGVEGFDEQENALLVERALDICQHFGGQIEEEALALGWLEERQASVFQRVQFSSEGAVVDTFHLFVRWSQLSTLRREVVQRLRGEAFFTIHLSHPTREGCFLTISFIAYGDGQKPLQRYEKIERLIEEVRAQFVRNNFVDPYLSEGAVLPLAEHSFLLDALESAIFETLTSTTSTNESIDE